MVYVTERSTFQRNMITGEILAMVSLFVAADAQEVEAAAADNYEAFLKEAREKGFMQLPPFSSEPVQTVSRTRSGFLIKLTSEVKMPDVEILVVQLREVGDQPDEPTTH